MPSVKCEQCGLVNFAGATYCKRCSAPFSHSPAVVTEDGYVLPPPPTGSSHLPAQGVWRSKSTLVMSKDAELPNRCIKCNQPASQRLKRKLTWHHPALYIIAPLALLIYLIVAMVVRKQATVLVPLCELHLANRRRAVLITWAIFILAIASFAAAIFLSENTFILVGVVFIFAAIIYGVIALRVVAPSKIDEYYVWLTGISKGYLETLPQWPGA